MKRPTNRTKLLTQDQVDAWFRVHLPYLRVCLTNHLRLCEDSNLFGTMMEKERYRVCVCAYEIGVLTCRKFIKFLGLSIKKDDQLIEKRDYYVLKGGNSYEVKVVDLGGKWVELSKLTDQEKDLLIRIYKTANVATAHLTDGSPYQGEWRIFHDAVRLVDKLLKENLFDIVGKTPTIQ